MTASPGRMRTSEKITMDTSHSTSSPFRARRTTYVRIRVQPTAANFSNFRLGAFSVIQAVLASYEQYPGNQQ